MRTYANICIAVAHSLQVENKREEYNNLCKEQDEATEKISVSVSLHHNVITQL